MIVKKLSNPGISHDVPSREKQDLRIIEKTGS